MQVLCFFLPTKAKLKKKITQKPNESFSWSLENM